MKIEFTEGELLALAVMCEASVPSCVYEDVLSAVHKIEAHLGEPPRGGWLREMERRWRERPKTDLQKGGGL